MSTALKMPESDLAADRPAWIPDHVTRDWDTNPYAYQTEEELTPAGGPRGQLLAYIMEVLRDVLAKRGLMLLIDTFMLYRDAEGTKKRVAPDLLLMPFRFPAPSAYDLDTEPPPLWVAEITSQKSRLKDLESNIPLYTGLGIPTYLAIDAITPGNRVREKFLLHLWQKKGNRDVRIPPDAEGLLTLPEMGVTVRAVGQRLVFTDAVTDEMLFDNTQSKLAARNERLRAENERKKAENERERAENERERAEKRAERLAEKLRDLGISPD
ncbi:Uma2 family endonuclease [Desulfobacterales bacterium HSG2]|nr:Uma2 family endonuclease [Desulfobacterales bacterium HSG2]